MNKAIILVDVQNDYFTGGKCELFEIEKTAEVVASLLEESRKNGDDVIFIQHINKNLNPLFFGEGTKGCEIHESVIPLPEEKIFVKHTPNSFYETGLDEYLRNQGISELIICGMMSHMCIDTTVRAAKNLGYKVTLIENACTTKPLNFGGEIFSATTVHHIFMAALNGTFCKICKH